MPVRHGITRRDAILILVGASCMHIFSLLFANETPAQQVVLADPVIHDNFPPDLPPPEKVIHYTKTTTLIQPTTTTVISTQPTEGPSRDSPVDFAAELPPTTLVSHAPGWTLFRDVYMANDTFYIVTDEKSKYPEIRMMTSTPLEAFATQESIDAREPTEWSMTFLTPAEAAQKWGADVRNGRRNRVSSVDGNTVFVNEPKQFLRHYYHLVAELLFGVQAMWHGAFTEPIAATAESETAYSLGPFPAPPPITRFIFARTNAGGWRDNPGFNRYILRAAFPSATVEVEEDWADRVSITTTGERAWHFPLLLLTDRSASHRGQICGSETQRIAAEPFEAMHRQGKLAGFRVGGWWEPVRSAILRFAGADINPPDNTDAEQVVLSGEGDLKLPMPSKVVVTYISRQSAGNRKLTQEAHDELVFSLQELAKAKGPSWELNIIKAEELTKDEQIRIASRTTILLGVHGNGLTHLIMMQPTRISTVIEIFYPGGFAHDYQWTTQALGMRHFAVWNDTWRTHGIGEGKPNVAYPDPGFQGNAIPVHGPTIVKLIEDRVEMRV
ncbi:hypothetical protein MKEN_00914200 [Mycena kentingensis (nom. inval.)]|nr:hypothetical protein MKEN_00914200 [Mycena kentingensis (nom. inval.)]